MGRATVRKALAFVVALVTGLGLLTGVAYALSVTIGVTVTLPAIPNPVAPVTNRLAYDIHTKGGAGCSTERTVSAVYGVPTPVDVGGNVLPDLLVLVAPLPTVPVVDNPTVLTVTVTRLTPAAPALVEAILAPSGPSDPSRVALGYDACSSSAPVMFTTNAVSQPTSLSLNVVTTGVGPDLAVLGSAFRQGSGATRVEPTSVRAKVAPVPNALSAAIDILPEDRYHAHLTTSERTTAAIDYVNATPDDTTKAHLTLDRLPRTTDIDFSSTAASYLLSTPVDHATVDVTKTASDPAEPTLRVQGAIDGLPADAGFTKETDHSASFTTTGTIGDLRVRYTSLPTPAPSVPPIPTDPAQALRAVSTSTSAVADLHLLGVGPGSVDWGDTIHLDLLHTAGPFGIDVKVPEAHVVGSIAPLPHDIDVTYAKATQAATYHGDGVIDSMVFDVTDTTAPIVGRADRAHFELGGVPTGLSTFLDSAGKHFQATMESGRLGSVELLLTNGPTDPVPGGGDGLLYLDDVAPPISSGDPHDHSGEVGPTDPVAPAPYELRLHASEIESAGLGWGQPIAVDLFHAPAPFQVQAKIARNQTDDDGHPLVQHLQIASTLSLVPHELHVQYYAPQPPIGIEVGPLAHAALVPGDHGIPRLDTDGTAARIVYRADGGLPRLEATVDSSTPLMAQAKHLQAILTDLPHRLDVDVNPLRKELTTDLYGEQLGGIDARLFQDPPSEVCPDLCLPEDGMGVIFDDIAGAHYRAQLRLGSVYGAEASWAGKIHVDVQTDGGRFNLFSRVNTHPAGRPVQVVGASGYIQTLPSDVDLTYDGDARAIRYQGSSSIDLLHAVVSQLPDPLIGGTDDGSPQHRIVGGGNWLTADLRDVSATASIFLEGATYDPGTDTSSCGGTATEQATGSGFCVDLAPGRIGQARLALVTQPDQPVPWDQIGLGSGVILDTSIPSRYLLAAQLNDIQHVELTKVDDGEPVTERHHDWTHIHATVDPTNSSRSHELAIFLRKPGTVEKADGVEYSTVRYAVPPPDIDVVLHNNIHGGDLRNDQAEITYRGSAVGHGLYFETNAGLHKTLMTAAIPEVPTRVFVCQSPRENCYSAYNLPHPIGESSLRIDVDPLPNGHLMELAIDDCSESLDGVTNGYLDPDLKLYCGERGIPIHGFDIDDYRMDHKVGLLHIRSGLRVHQETDEDCFPDCVNITLDTHAEETWGQYTEYTDIDITPKSDIRLPQGFKAHHWGVQINCDIDGCDGSHFGQDSNAGDPWEDDIPDRITCPVGMSLFSRAGAGITVEAADEFCPAPSVDSPTFQAHVRRSAVGATLSFVGQNLPPDVDPGDLLVLDSGGHVVDGFHVSSVVLRGFDFLDVVVTLDPDVAAGTYSIRFPSFRGTVVGSQAIVVDP